MLWGDQGLNPKYAEHSRAINYDATDYGPLREDSAEAGGLGLSEVVGSGGDLPSGYEGVGGAEDGEEERGGEEGAHEDKTDRN